MAFPVYRLNGKPHGRSRLHVEIATADGVLLACGSIPADWLENVQAKGHEVSIMMVAPEDCDHGGTYRQPRSVWDEERERVAALFCGQCGAHYPEPHGDHPALAHQ